MRVFIIILLWIFVAVFQQVHSSCLESMKNWKSAPIDPNFLTVGKTFYYPYMGRLDLSLRGVAILKLTSTDQLEEDVLYYDSCIRFKMSRANVVKFAGFNGRSVTYWFEKDEEQGDGQRHKMWRPTERPNEKDEYNLMFTMTDNATYAVLSGCTSTNKFSWSVITTEPSLLKDTVRSIHKHLESLGGNKKQFTRIRYSCCIYSLLQTNPSE